jgi:hypothetical protein
MKEADNYVNTQVGLHALSDLDNPDDELNSLASSLAAETYLHFVSPGQSDMKAIDKYEKRIQDHIMAKYGQKSAGGTTNNTFGKTSSKITGTET